MLPRCRRRDPPYYVPEGDAPLSIHATRERERERERERGQNRREGGRKGGRTFASYLS